jgi:hypothetical protein
VFSGGVAPGYSIVPLQGTKNLVDAVSTDDSVKSFPKKQEFTAWHWRPPSRRGGRRPVLPQIRVFESKGKLAIVKPQRRMGCAALMFGDGSPLLIQDFH